MKPNKLGLLGSLKCVALECLLAQVRIFKRLQHRSRLDVYGHVRIHPSADFLGPGSIILGAGVSVGRDVLFISESDAVIEIGPKTVVERGALVRASSGARLSIGSQGKIGRDSLLLAASELCIGEVCQIGPNSIIAPRESVGKGRLIMGRNVWLNQGNIIDLCGDVVIEDEVALSPNCCIYTHNHTREVSELIWDNPLKIAPCSIGFGTWIGHGSIIMPGVSIGRHSVVAAGAVVTKSVPDHSAVGGVPARLLRGSA